MLPPLTLFLYQYEIHTRPFLHLLIICVTQVHCCFKLACMPTESKKISAAWLQRDMIILRLYKFIKHRSTHTGVFLKEIKKYFCKICKILRKDLCRTLFFNKYAGWSPANIFFKKKETPTQVLSCEFAKFLKTCILWNTSGWLLL